MHATLSWPTMAAICLLFSALPIATASGIDPASSQDQAIDAPPSDQPAAKQFGGEAEFVEPKPGHHPGHAFGGWYLGVYGHYTPTGLVLTNVYPRTPAARVGLEVGDRIVSVNGRQVGGATGLPIDLSLQRYASPGGIVRLLVQDRRTRLLVIIDVQLIRGRIHT